MDPQLIIFLAVGLVAGWLAGLLLGGGGLIRNLVVGVVGAFVGKYMVDIMKLTIGLGNPLLDQIAVATIGAIAVVILARLVAR
jgi:uncharacterized membrane protein YeaQ/YmgE (transglycosylase-associated protein family)